jgi:lauroyl/myristoyl acyltransferase
MMDYLLYAVARGLIGGLQALPLPWVARLGRAAGGLAHALDARHRRVARENLRLCFPEMSEPDRRRLAKENFRRIGENFASSVKTASMTNDEVRGCLEWGGDAYTGKLRDATQTRGAIIAIGHFGNFELYARASLFVPGFQFATTYRGLRQPVLDRLLLSLREQSGCLYFERRSGGEALREALNHQRLMLGLLVDQHAGDRGLPAPFFGRECSSSAASAVYALRYQLPLHTAVCYRVGLGRWRIEVGPEIPTRDANGPRPSADIAADVNRAFEQAIRRDPANWFWVHRRWKTVRRHPRPPATSPAAPPPA